MSCRRRTRCSAASPARDLTSDQSAGSTRVSNAIIARDSNRSADLFHADGVFGGHATRALLQNLLVNQPRRS